MGPVSFDTVRSLNKAKITLNTDSCRSHLQKSTGESYSKYPTRRPHHKGYFVYFFKVFFFEVFYFFFEGTYLFKRSCGPCNFQMEFFYFFHVFIAKSIHFSFNHFCVRDWSSWLHD
ncbi:hypothetical protein BD770DRAFT_383636 [Pilaira anomala]|nr:hypothetical protein BD770DRAFT_383636 [Pilaira anomala]